VGRIFADGLLLLLRAGAGLPANGFNQVGATALLLNKLKGHKHKECETEGALVTAVAVNVHTQRWGWDSGPSRLAKTKMARLEYVVFCIASLGSAGNR